MFLLYILYTQFPVLKTDELRQDVNDFVTLTKDWNLFKGEHFIIIIIITSTSDLQPSTPTANQLPGQLVSTEIRTTYV